MKRLVLPYRLWFMVGGAALLIGAVVATTYSQTQTQKIPFPGASSSGSDSSSSSSSYEKALTGYTKVVSTTDGKAPLFEIWVDKKKGGMLAKLPSNVESKKYYFALTIAGGEKFAGLQAGERYLYWKKYGDRIALIEPNLDMRSTGDQESKNSIKRLYTGKVLTDVPIVATSPAGEPLVDMTELLIKQAPKFFGVKTLDPNQMYRLKEIKTAKAFPQNVELAFEIPVGTGQLKTFHYSISEIPDSTGYKARKADDRIGYFTTSFLDLGKYKAGETKVRYINRWHLEKADTSLKLSPPKNPIVFYIEHTTPIRYRRFVKDGILAWNKAFEKVGIVNAIEVYQQDATTGAHMDKDPEDVRYNFVRWLNNNVGLAIGPSRVHPLTGQILDADVILTDGWIRHFEKSWAEVLPQMAMESLKPEALVWLERNPSWDPRFLLAPAHKRNMMLAQKAMKGPLPLGGHPLANVQTSLLGDDEFDGLVGRNSQVNGMCLAAAGKAFDLTILRMTLEMISQEKDDKKDKKDDKDKKADKEEQKEEEEVIDGIPTKFLGPLLTDLVAHEVGHTLGLRHNFKASSVYNFKDINSNKVRGKKPFAGSVMDYIPVNIDMKDGEIQGDYSMIDIGPYDIWAIEYGYTMDDKVLPKILARCTEPELQFATDQDTMGPDPLAMRYDFSANPIDYAKSQIKLINYHRERLLDKYVKDGESWAKARKGYEMTLAMQMRSLSMMSSWVGGAFIHRDHKGDKGNRPPVVPVPVEQQRAALKWVMESTFRDGAFGLTPKVLQRLKNDSLISDESFFSVEDPAFPIHDRIMGMQGSVLTMLMNPYTLRMVYDNERTVDEDKDAVTLPELLQSINDEVFSELKMTMNGKYSDRKPMISSLRRNLQRGYIERLIDLINPGMGNPAATKPISQLAIYQLKKLNKQIDNALKTGVGKLDSYTTAHLEDAQTRITKVLDSQYIFNAKDIGGGGGGFSILFNQQGQQFQGHNPAPCHIVDCPHCNRPNAGSWYKDKLSD